MINLSEKLGEVGQDNLITDITPKTETRGKTIRKTAAETVLKRGTILAKSAADGKLVVLGETGESGDTLTADCILCDDTKIGTDEDVEAVVYTAGCFNINKVTVKEEYELTEADYDNLRKYNIVFKAASV